MHPWWKFLLGYVIINLQGLGLERFLSNAEQQGIRFYELRRFTYTTIQATVSYFDYRALKKKKSAVQVIPVSFGGVLSVICFFLRRWWLAAGLLLAVAGCFILSGLCLGVQIEGLSSISEFAVYEVVRSEGGRPMAWKSQIDRKAIEQALWEAFPSLTYVYVDFSGTNLRVILDEGYQPPTLRDETPASIVAEKEGVVTEIIVGNGKAAVKVGQIVKKGDTLITGQYQNGEISFCVSAQGIVRAHVSYIGKYHVAYQKTEKVKTGKTATERWMRIGDREIRLSGENPFSCYLMEEKRVSSLGENQPVYVEYIDRVYYEAEEQPSEDNRSNAEREAKEAAYQRAMMALPEDAQVIRFDSQIEETEQGLEAVVTIVAEEEIGERESIAIEEDQTEEMRREEVGDRQ